MQKNNQSPVKSEIKNQFPKVSELQLHKFIKKCIKNKILCYLRFLILKMDFKNCNIEKLYIKYILNLFLKKISYNQYINSKK